MHFWMILLCLVHAIQEGHDLGAGAGLIRAERRLARPVGDALLHSPNNRSTFPFRKKTTRAERFVVKLMTLAMPLAEARVRCASPVSIRIKNVPVPGP